MSRFTNLVKKAGKSQFYLWILNRILLRKIPFNAPHHIIIKQISPGNVVATLPYRKQNLNHLKGIHACALATLCEYVSGLSLSSVLPENSYRIIMKKLNMEYFYQARMDVLALALVEINQAKERIINPLESDDSVEFLHEVMVNDVSGNHICTAEITWQFKNWAKVRTK